MIKFRASSSLDPDALRSRFDRDGRIQIDQFLDPAGATALRSELVASSRWRHVINGADKVFEIPASEFDALDPVFRARLDEATNRTAATQFQFQYDAIRVPDESIARGKSPHLLDRFPTFLASDEMLDFFQRVSGSTDIRFADAQATRYRPRDFLTRHDDAISGKDRKFAYVLNLVEDWRAEWGGLLMFLGPNGRVVETFVPGLNSLSLFAVGQQHLVTPVAEYAPEPRLSVTGWLRSRSPEGTPD